MAPRDNWFGHTFNRARWQPQRQVIALATLGLFVAIIMGALYLSQSSTQSVIGRQLEDMIDTRDQLEQSVEQLRSEIANLQSMPRLQARAEALGFTSADAGDIIYVVVDGYDPEREISVQPLTAPVDSLPEYDETFGGWLNSIFSTVRRQFESFTQEVTAP